MKTPQRPSTPPRQAAPPQTPAAADPVTALTGAVAGVPVPAFVADAAARLAPPAILEEFLEKIRTRQARIGVMGLGYVGLPLLKLFASKGFTTIGFDVDEGKVERIQKGQSYIQAVPTEQLRELVQEKKLSATTDFS